MSPPSINMNTGRSTSGIPGPDPNPGNDKDHSTCFPCDASASADRNTTTLSSAPMPMQLDAPHRQNDAQGCGSASMSEGTASAFMPPPHRQQPQQQQPQAGPIATPTNVGELVAKAKKAAISLWMILHAQNCRQSEEICTHRGCAETKRMLIHVKGCSAGPNSPCPTNCKGCNETRKLIAHYRRCKDMRLKQVAAGSSRRPGLLIQQPDQKSCLVCSLMARYAKGVMDKNKNSPQVKKKKTVCLLSNSTDAKFKVERGLAIFPSRASSASPPRRTPSMTLMPPPPPRSNSLPTSPSTTIKMNMSNESFGTTLATIPNPSKPAHRSLSDPSFLNRSDEGDSSSSSSSNSNVMIPFPILKNREAGEEELVIPGLPRATAPVVGRQRSVSYDERKVRVKFAPTVVTKEQYYFKEHEHEPLEEEQERHPRDGLPSPTRPRSSSCINMGRSRSNSNASLSSANGCETIDEEWCGGA